MATFRFSLAAFNEQVLSAPWMIAQMRSRAERGQAFAETIAPVSDRLDTDEDRYIDSFDVDAHDGGGRDGDRAEAILWNHSGHAIYVEFGNGTAEYQGDHVLMRALNAMR